MEQFSLEKYLANPSRKVVTRNGRNVRIICTDRRDLNFPIVTLIENFKSQLREDVYVRLKKHALRLCGFYKLADNFKIV